MKPSMDARTTEQSFVSDSAIAIHNWKVTGPVIERLQFLGQPTNFSGRHIDIRILVDVCRHKSRSEFIRVVYFVAASHSGSFRESSNEISWISYTMICPILMGYKCYFRSVSRVKPSSSIYKYIWERWRTDDGGHESGRPLKITDFKRLVHENNELF